MHPLGSIDILLAAEGSLHLSIFHCLSIILTSSAPFYILKHLIYRLPERYNLSTLSFCWSIFALAGLALAIFCHGDGWALLISVFTKRIEVAACPVAQGPACFLELREQEKGWPAPKMPNLSQTCTLQAGTCVCVCVCVCAWLRQSKRERERKKEKERGIT